MGDILLSTTNAVTSASNSLEGIAMIDRKQLHHLVDSLPEGALESAHTYLAAIQTWPPKPIELPPDVLERRRQLEETRDRFIGRPASGGWSISRDAKTHGSFSDGRYDRETGEYTAKTFRVHHGFPIMTTEKYRTKDDEQTLEYEYILEGLGEKRHLVVQCRVGEGPSPQ
jgi:hypothetical protein